jgi:hypothetical protein
MVAVKKLLGTAINSHAVDPLSTLHKIIVCVKDHHHFLALLFSHLVITRRNTISSLYVSFMVPNEIVPGLFDDSVNLAIHYTSMITLVPHHVGLTITVYTASVGRIGNPRH